MAEISTSRLKDILQRTVGPTPWYWKTFPAFNSVSGQRFTWTHHGSEGPVGYVVTLALQQEPAKPRPDKAIQSQSILYRDKSGTLKMRSQFKKKYGLPKGAAS